MKERYYRIERNGVEVKYRKTEEGKNKVVEAWTAKGYEVKVSIVYM